MRKFNAVLSLLLVGIFILHGILGSFMLLNLGETAWKHLARAGVGILAVHIIIGLVLTIKTLRTMSANREKYWKENALFWARRISGLAIAVFVVLHMGIFGELRNGQYVLFAFTPARLVLHLLLLVSLFLHIFLNVRPLLVSLGIPGVKQRYADICLVLSVFLLFMAAAAVIYFIGWAL